MTTIASWNVNSIRARESHLRRWIDENPVDVLGLQETKVQDQDFPKEVVSTMGFNVFYTGQKSYNGVCTIFKGEASLIADSIPGFEDDQKRVIAIEYKGILIINAYVPNGSDVGSSKYEYKLSWLEAFCFWLQKLSDSFDRIVVLGDFNIAPTDSDVHDPKAWQDKILCSPKERHYLDRLRALDFLDSFRLFQQPEESFSWWDYRGGSFRRNMGLRIDLIYISSSMKKDIKSSSIDVNPRSWEKPSDHAPILLEL